MLLDATTTLINAAPLRRCAACEYDLRGLTQNRCPECGLEFDPNYLPPAEVPWLRRGDPRGFAYERNTILAYYRTVELVLLWPGRFGEMVWRDVEVRPSETTRFRWLTIGVASGSALATMLPALGPAQSVVALPLLAVPVTLFFWMATARFNLIQFRADRFADEMRYRRLHELSCAGLALAPAVPAIILAGFVFGWRSSSIALGAFLLACGVLAAWWIGSLFYQLHGGRCTRGDAILHAFLLPFAWLMIAIVILVFSMGLVGLGLAIFR